MLKKKRFIGFVSPVLLLCSITLFAQSDMDNPTPPTHPAPELTPNPDGSEVYVQVINNAPGMWEYRWFNQDLDWSHTFDPQGKIIVSATLEIAAWDVDYYYGEIDLIYADGVLLGNLQGANRTWSITKFNVPVDLLKDGVLKVFINIDSTHQQYWWAVTIGWSKLTVVYTIEIKTFEDAFRVLYAVLLQLSDILPPGNATSITRTLAAAADAIAEGKYTVAINLITAAMKELEGLSGKTVGGKLIDPTKVREKIDALTSMVGFLRGVPPTEIPKVCLCVWTYTIDTTYHGPYINKMSPNGLLGIVGEGASIWMRGSMYLWGFESEHIPGSSSTGTYVTVQRMTRCPKCMPEIVLNGFVKGSVKSYFFDSILGIGTGHSTSAGRGKARNDLNYISEEAVTSTDNPAGIRVNFKGIGVTISGEVPTTIPIGDSAQETKHVDFAQVYLESFCSGDMAGDTEFGGVAGHEVSGGLDHTLIITAKCISQEPDHVCLGSLTVNLTRNNATAKHDEVRTKSISSPAHHGRGEQPGKNWE